MTSKSTIETINVNDFISKTMLSPDYKPHIKEEFMNPMQQEYFRQKLLLWKNELINESSETLSSLQEDSLSAADMNDRASLEIEHAFELRTSDRYRKLIAKIDEVLRNIDIGEYGYCEISGDEIPLERLEVRPTAIMTVESQEFYERGERVRKDDRE